MSIRSKVQNLSKNLDEKATFNRLEEYRKKNREEVDQVITTKLPEMVLQYKNLLEEDFRMDRLKEGDILPTVEEIGIFRRDKDARYRILLSTVIGTSAACFVISSDPPLGNLFFVIFAVAVYYLMGTLRFIRRDDNYDIVPNEKLQQLADKLRPLINQHIDDLRKLFLWVSLNIPEIQGGNNFGVHIQEAVTKKITYVTTTCDKLLLALGDLKNKKRADVAHELARHPYMKGYKEAIHEIDMTEFLHIRYYLAHLRDDINTLHDLILKNIDKIETPRGDTEKVYTMY